MRAEDAGRTAAFDIKCAVNSDGGLSARRDINRSGACNVDFARLRCNPRSIRPRRAYKLELNARLNART